MVLIPAMFSSPVGWPSVTALASRIESSFLVTARRALVATRFPAVALAYDSLDMLLRIATLLVRTTSSSSTGSPSPMSCPSLTTFADGSSLMNASRADGASPLITGPRVTMSPLRTKASGAVSAMLRIVSGYAALLVVVALMFTMIISIPAWRVGMIKTSGRTTHIIKSKICGWCVPDASYSVDSVLLRTIFNYIIGVDKPLSAHESGRQIVNDLLCGVFHANHRLTNACSSGSGLAARTIGALFSNALRMASRPLLSRLFA